jgi:hypothetical protein
MTEKPADQLARPEPGDEVRVAFTTDDGTVRRYGGRIMARATNGDYVIRDRQGIDRIESPERVFSAGPAEDRPPRPRWLGRLQIVLLSVAVLSLYASLRFFGLPRLATILAVIAVVSPVALLVHILNARRESRS